MKNRIIPYNPILREYARQLRKNSTLSEVLLWQKIKQRALGVQFHRQVPLLDFIVDFYCHEIHLAIEIDGNSHDFKYEDDARREKLLENKGVEFIRFSDSDIKNNMFGVELALEEKVQEMLKRNRSTTPVASGESIDNSCSKTMSAKQEKTPLRSPQGDNSLNKPLDFTFPKKEKLKRKKLIESLFAKGKSVSKYPIKLIYVKTELPEDVPIQAGVSVPKRNFKKAVQRNRIKRLLRESYRLNKHYVFNNIEGNYAFLFLYIGKEMPTYIEVEESMKTVLRKFVQTRNSK